MITVDVNDIIEDKDKYRNIEELKIVGKAPKDCNWLLSHFGFRIVDVSELDVSDVESVRFFFSGCEKLEEVKGLSEWRNDKRELFFSKYFLGFFDGCKSLKG